MNTIIYEVNPINQSSVEDVVMSLNDMPNITAIYYERKDGTGAIHIIVPDNLSLEDVFGLGYYVAQIETFSLM